MTNLIAGLSALPTTIPTASSPLVSQGLFATPTATSKAALPQTSLVALQTGQFQKLFENALAGNDGLDPALSLHNYTKNLADISAAIPVENDAFGDIILDATITASLSVKPIPETAISDVITEGALLASSAAAPIQPSTQLAPLTPSEVADESLALLQFSASNTLANTVQKTVAATPVTFGLLSQGSESILFEDALPINSVPADGKILPSLQTQTNAPLTDIKNAVTKTIISPEAISLSAIGSSNVTADKALISQNHATTSAAGKPSKSSSGLAITEGNVASLLVNNPQSKTTKVPDLVAQNQILLNAAPDNLATLPSQKNAKNGSVLTSTDFLQTSVSSNLLKQADVGSPNAARFTPHPTVVEQIQVKLSSAVKEGQNQIHIQLEPEQLGKVDIKLDIAANGKTSAIVIADRQETLDILQKEVRGLERALSNAGLETNTGSLQFGLRGGEQQREQFADTKSNGSLKDISKNSLAEIEKEIPVYLTDKILDIRV